jgi:hypothetical protein
MLKNQPPTQGHCDYIRENFARNHGTQVTGKQTAKTPRAPSRFNSDRQESKGISIFAFLSSSLNSWRPLRLGG